LSAANTNVLTTKDKMAIVNFDRIEFIRFSLVIELINTHIGL